MHLCPRCYPLDKNIVYFSCSKKVTNSIGGGGSQFTPLIRNILAMVFEANSIEYNPIDN